jgi:hypothetical protein
MPLFASKEKQNRARQPIADQQVHFVHGTIKRCSLTDLRD